MLECSARIRNFEEIRQYITQTLSDIEQLKTDSYQITEQLLTRGGQPCGVYFCMHGPRSVRLTAIWETDANTILFYGSQGERVGRSRLVNAPVLFRPPARCLTSAA